MGGSLIENVASWLETQGYPLEMEIASIAQGCGFDVSQSDYYQDPEDNKYREIDLVLSLSKFSNRFHLSYNLLVECKSGKDKPWLLLSTQNYLKGTETLPTGDPQLRRFTVYGAFIGNDLGQDVLLRATHDQLDNIFPRLSMEDILGYGITQAFAKGNEVPFEGLISAHR